MIIDYLTIASFIIAGLGFSFGLDFKKWWSWIFVLSGFVGGYLIFLDLENPSSFYGSIFIGAFFALFTAWGARLQKRRIIKARNFFEDIFRSDNEN